MACFLSFGVDDLDEFSRTKRIACLALDLLSFSVVALCTSIMALVLLLIKSIVRCFLYLHSLITHRQTLRMRQMFAIRTDLWSEHLIALIPVIGNIVHGLLLVHHAIKKNSTLSFLDTAIIFFGSSLSYVNHLIQW